MIGRGLEYKVICLVVVIIGFFFRVRLGRKGV